MYHFHLDGSRKVQFSNNNVNVTPSILDNYSKRQDLKGFIPNLQNCNIVQFVSQFTVYKNEIKRRTKNVVVRTYPNFSSNPKSEYYPLYCRYQLVKYKPWSYDINNLWDSMHPSG